MKAFIVNDTTKIVTKGKRFQHFGCELVMQTFREQLKRVDIELVGTVGRKIVKVPPKTLVIVNGEGSVHHKRFPYMVNIANQYPAVFVNAVWQDNPSYPAMHKFKYVAVRESESFKQLPHDLPNAEIVPDIIFTSETLRSFKKPPPTQSIGKTDNSVDKNAGITAHITANHYLSNISQYEKLCVGRFHALIVASVLGIPFSAWKPTTHKNIGILTDMGVPHLYFETQQEALENIPDDFDERIAEYVEQAQLKIDRMFENFHNIKI